MKMARQISELIDKNSNFRNYYVIESRGSINYETGETTFVKIRFKSPNDLIDFISLLFVTLRCSYTSCDTILLGEILKSSKVTAEPNGDFSVEFVNYQLSNKH